jgi:hypothetical protein
MNVPTSKFHWICGSFDAEYACLGCFKEHVRWKVGVDDEANVEFTLDVPECCL